MKMHNGALLQALREDDAALVESWLSAAQLDDPSVQRSAATEAAAILSGFRSGLEAGGDPGRLEGSVWADLRDSLEALSSSRAAKGESAGATSSFVLAMKKPLLETLRRQLGNDVDALMAAVWSLGTAVDSIAQHTVSTFQRTREDIIRRQQEDLLELSTPVVKLWEGVLAVPMIGVLDSNRTQMVMETLLQTIVETGSELAIIDITGVPTVDTLVAQHLLKTVAAIRLMGADCIISGIRPQIAQTIVHLGIDLQGITTKASLADALSLALQRTGWRITRQAV